MLLRLSALLILAMSAFFVQRAAVPIIEQNRKVRKWPAVDAKVTARFVEAPKRGPGTPRSRGLESVPPMMLQVEYHHELDGNAYRTIKNNPRSEEWSPAGPDLISKREASYIRRGHYDPARPDQLIFPKPFGFADYWQIFFWAPLLGLGFAALTLRKSGSSAHSVLDPGENGWYRLRPKYSIRYRASGAWIIAIVCNLILGLAAYDYVTSEPRARTPLANALVCLALIPGVIALGVAIYYTWLAQRVGEARVSIDAARIVPGMRLAVLVDLPVKSKIDLEHLIVSLACVRSAFERRFRERVVWEERVEMSVARRAQAGGRIRFEQRFTVSQDAAPNFVGGLFGPWIDWESDCSCGSTTVRIIAASSP